MSAAFVSYVSCAPFSKRGDLPSPVRRSQLVCALEIHAHIIREIGIVDKTTEEWPVPLKLCKTLDKIKHTHHAVPLRVFVDEKKIGMDDVTEMLMGALTEIHFELRHYAIKGKDVDSFNGNVEQIMVLQPGIACPATAYKRSTSEDGPIRMNPLLATLQHEFVSARPGETSGKVCRPQILHIFFALTIVQDHPPPSILPRVLFITSHKTQSRHRRDIIKSMISHPLLLMPMRFSY
jgi:hypothetical protein